MTADLFSEPVCVVIVDEGIAEDEVHRGLGDALPQRVASWQDQGYLAAITTLRPQLIVVWGIQEELLHERCRLVASLFSRFEPTVISATMAEESQGAPHLTVQQLGAGATAQIRGLRDVQLP
ncbi:MAG TPA: hypothetical protein VF916_04220 [Ktedonobacterales bacterium]